MSEIKLVLSEIDGVLISKDNQVEFGVKKGIDYLKKNECVLVLVSKHAPNATFNVMNRLNIPTTNPMICFDGALCGNYNETKFETISSHLLDKEDALEIVKLLRFGYPDVSVSVYSNNEWLVEKSNKWTTKIAAFTETEFVEKNIIKAIKRNLPVHKIVCMGNPNELSLIENLLDRIGRQHVSFYRTDDHYLEIVNTTVSLASAQEELLTHLGISPDKVLSIGVTYMSLPMLQESGIGVALKNAPRIVKDLSHYVGQDSEKQGWYKTITQFIN